MVDEAWSDLLDENGRADTRRVPEPDFLFDDELAESEQLAELEQRCSSAGADVAHAMREAGYEFDPSTYVIGEIVRVAQDRGADVDDVVEWFERHGVIDRTTSALDE